MAYTALTSHYSRQQEVVVALGLAADVLPGFILYSKCRILEVEDILTRLSECSLFQEKYNYEKAQEGQDFAFSQVHE